MSNLVFLGVALVVSVVGVLVLWLRHRPPSSPTASIDEFQGKMRALAPDEEEQADGGRVRRRGGRGA